MKNGAKDCQSEWWVKDERRSKGAAGSVPRRPSLNPEKTRKKMDWECNRLKHGENERNCRDYQYGVFKDKQH